SGNGSFCSPVTSPLICADASGCCACSTAPSRRKDRPGVDGTRCMVLTRGAAGYPEALAAAGGAWTPRYAREPTMRSARRSDFRPAWSAAALPCPVLARAEGDHHVAPDRRSGTVVLRFADELQRTYGFSTGGYGLERAKGGVHNVNSQLVVASTPEG